MIDRARSSTVFPYTTLFRSIRRGGTSCRIGRVPDIHHELARSMIRGERFGPRRGGHLESHAADSKRDRFVSDRTARDRKSTRLNSNHSSNSYDLSCPKYKLE